jgi:hypothetical protein
VVFPTMLNMAPYLSDGVRQQRQSPVSNGMPENGDSKRLFNSATCKLFTHAVTLILFASNILPRKQNVLVHFLLIRRSSRQHAHVYMVHFYAFTNVHAQQ